MYLPAHFFGNRQAIDHLYLATDALGFLVVGTAQVLRDNARSFGDSDHSAVRATFEVP